MECAMIDEIDFAMRFMVSTLRNVTYLQGRADAPHCSANHAIFLRYRASELLELARSVEVWIALSRCE